jgi:hypothetical protein
MIDNKRDALAGPIPRNEVKEVIALRMGVVGLGGLSLEAVRNLYASLVVDFIEEGSLDDTREIRDGRNLPCFLRGFEKRGLR